ncbi:MAG: hypothetical protein IK086_08050, partial [Clostridia bacterium]|nr:hypothetical protein [Clostridia bacterium]
MKKSISLALSFIILLSCINVLATPFVAAEGTAKVLSEEFEGYTRVLLSDFKTSAGNALAISAAPAGTAVLNTASSRFYNTVGAEESDSYLLDKTYFDFDINLAESTTAPSIMLYEKADWNDYLRLRFNNTAGTVTLDYISAYTGSTVTRFSKKFSLIDYGRTSTNEFFNVKIRADFSANSTDSTKRDATFQLWLNNRFVTEETLTGEDMRNGLFIRPGGETIYLREPKYLAEELAGYQRVDMLDFSKSLDENGVVSFAASDHATPSITDFDNTYLDVDLNYAGETGRGSAVFQYLAYAKWTNSLYLGFKSSASTFILSKYDHVRTLTDLATLTASDFGISPSEYFNVKLRTDIEIISASEYSVTAQLWLNNKFACQVTTDFVYGPDAEVPAGKTNQAAGQTGVGIDIRTVSKAVSVRSAVDVESQLSGYKRVTSEDFKNINGTKSEVGRDWVSAKAGEYNGDTSDLSKSYFEADIKAPNGANPFMVWLSKNKTKTETDFYGDGEQLRFYLSTTKLKLMKVHAGGNAGTETFADISLAPYNYSEDAFFNFKVKTDIYSDGLIGIAVWVNNIFVKKIFINTYDTETIEDMTCAGFRGTSEKPVYVRTPVIQDNSDIPLPVFDGQQHFKTVSYSGTISNGALENFNYDIEDLSAPAFMQYTIAASEIANNSSVVLALVKTDYIAEAENCFFGLRLTPQNGWDISLFDNNMVRHYDYLLSQNYPDTDTTEAGSADYTVTVKTENGLLSVWINGVLVCRNYKNNDYNIVSPKVAVYVDTTPITAGIEMWCETDNYNLLGDINGDLTVDICDLIHMKKVVSGVDNATAINDYVKAFNDNGSIGPIEITLFKNYILGLSDTLTGGKIRLIAPRNGTVTALASAEVNTLTTDYDYTEYRAEQFRVLHKDQYYRDGTILKWICPDNADGYTVFVGTNANLTGAFSYNSAKSNLKLDNLLPDTT